MKKKINHNFELAIERLAEFSSEKKKQLREIAMKVTEHIRPMLKDDDKVYGVSKIGPAFGMNGAQLNTVLCNYGVQWRSSTQDIWPCDYEKDSNFAETIAFTITHKTDGRTETKYLAKWTAAGLVYLTNLLLEIGLTPVEKTEEKAEKAEKAEQTVAEKAEQTNSDDDSDDDMPF